MAKLSETFTYGGGNTTAPSSIPQLTQTSAKPKLSETFSYDTKVTIPKTQPTAVPKLSQPTVDYDAVIKEYESLPKTNIFSRLFNKKSEEAYNRKQELNPQYEQAKDIQTVKKLNSLGALDDVKKLWDTYEGHDEVYTPLYDLLKSKGVTDKKELNDLVNNIEAMQKREGIERANKYLTEYADEHPVLGSALTVPTKMVTGLGSVAETGMNYVAGKPMSNASSVSLSGNKTANEMRNTVSKDMNGVGKFLYGSGMSMADMLANRWLLGPVGNLSMGFEKGADTMNEAIDQGLNPTQIVGKGLASGATTYITEKLLTSKALDEAQETILGMLKEGGLKALGKNGIAKVLLPLLVKSGASEGAQEGLEDVADTIADMFIAGGKNELTQSYNQYKANGLSDDEALKKVAGDKALELLEDTAGGFLSGFLMGGAEMGKSGMEYNLNNRNNIPTLGQQNASSVDKTSTTGYNQGTTTEVEKGVSYDGREESSGYDGRRSDRLLRELPTREQQGIDGLHSLGTPGINTPSSSGRSTSVLGYDNKVFSEDMDVDPSVSSFDFRYSNNNAQDFHDAFEAAKASNDHGGAVDSHSVEDLQQIVNDGGNLFMSADKTAFGAVTGDGNLTSVAKAKNSPHKAAAMNVAKTAVKLGATKGDCYGKALVNMYAPAGFKPVARCEYVFGFNGAMDAQVREQLESGQITKAPDVYALVYDNAADASKKYSQSELDALPLYEGESAYDDMLAYRDSLIAPKSKATTANKELPSINKVMKEDTGINGHDEEYDSGAVRLVESVKGGIPDIRTRNTYTSQVARNTLEKFYSQDEKSYQRLVDNVLEGKYQVELQRMKDTNSKAVERIEKYSPDTTYDDVMRNGVNSAEDVALVHNLMKWYQAQGDFDKVDMLSLKLTHGGHNIGQTLQYFKAFGDSALGMNQATDTLAGSKTKELVNKAKKNPNGKAAKMLKQNAKLASALQQIEGLGQMEKAPKTEATYQQILQEVRNTLAKESASFEDRFTDTDVEYLARMLHNGATTEDIKNALDRHLATGYFGMSQEDLQAITELYNKADKAKTSKERAELKEQAAAISAKYIGSSTFMDKWNAWRYLAMLGNPRTLIRNRLGNFTFRQVTNIKDFVAAGLENAAQAAGIKFDRTKSMTLNPVTDSDLFKASRADFDNVAYEEATKGGSKYNMKSAVEGKKKVFDTKGIEWLRDKVSNQLEQDDIKALKAKYTQALAGYLKANGYGADVLKTDNAILDKARAYAIQQAKIATFHEDSKTANLLNDLERRARESGGLAGKTAEILMESTMPFKKTPINILKQGASYSPASLLNMAYHIATKADANVWIDDLAKSLTGTGIMWLGYLLGNSGLLIGQRKDEDDPFNKGSNYALNIGDKSITIDWLAPAALPLFVGCELANSVSDKSESGELALLETVASISEPVVEMSMMQGLENALSSLSNTKNFKGATFLENVATGYASQIIPTLSGQLARTIDPLRRTTRTNVSAYDRPLGAALEKAKQKAVNKIPGLSMTNEPYLNAWGETEKNASGVFGGNVLGRALQNFVLPGYVNDTSLNSREKGLAKLEETYKKNGYSGSLIPSLADNNKPNGTRLSNEEYTRWAQTRGNEMKKAVDAGLLYKNKVSTKELQDYMHDLELLANAIAKNKQFGTEIPKTYKKKYEAYKKGGYSAVIKYLIETSK